MPIKVENIFIRYVRAIVLLGLNSQILGAIICNNQTPVKHEFTNSHDNFFTRPHFPLTITAPDSNTPHLNGDQLRQPRSQIVLSDDYLKSIPK